MPGRIYELRSEVRLPSARDVVFQVFADASNLEQLTPPFLKFHVVTAMPIEMKPGSLIDYRLKLHGIPIRWRTKITKWDPPFRFEDSQIRGPYSMWVHLHEFEQTEDGTLVKDVVRYSVPGGALIHWLFVERDLHRIFAFRQAQLPKLLKIDSAKCDFGPIQISPLNMKP